MTPELLACVRRSQEAERAGDAEAALEWHQAVPMYRKGRHRSVLAGLVSVGDDLPAWVWARWIVYQATRCESGDTGKVATAIRLAVLEAFHQDLLEECFDKGGDPVRVQARVFGESWLCHQLVPYEGDGLVAFIDEFATCRLAEHADLARSWAQEPLDGFEIGESLPEARVQVRKANGGDWMHVLDVGARSASADSWVLGRLVPTGEGGLMFDSPPLAVPERVARRVASSINWLEVVARSLRRGQLAGADLMREDYELMSDVMELELLRFGTRPRDHARVLQQLRQGRDEIGRAAYRVLERARLGEVAGADQAMVGAAVLNVHAFDEMRKQLRQSGDPGCLGEWRDRMAAPAAHRLEHLLPRR